MVSNTIRYKQLTNTLIMTVPRFSWLVAALLICISMLCSTAYATNIEATPKKQTAQRKSNKSAQKNNKRESSASVKRKEANVNKEIKLTQKQIEENEASIKANLAILDNLDRDIKLQNEKVRSLQNQEKRLTADIAACQAKIEIEEQHLEGLRTHYTSSIKKMRVARKRNNPLAFIFSSKTFYQAWRRIRYLKKFGEWRARRETEIKNQIELLDKSRAQLSAGKKQLENNLNSQQEAQKILASKHSAQNAAIKELRAHGDALRNHLAQKQAEANQLQARVITLIAAEQEEARIAEQRRIEQAKKAAEEKAAKEREAAAKAAAAKEKEAREKESIKKEEAPKPSSKKKKNKDKSKKEATPKKKEQEKPAQEKQESSGKSYAEARNRRPRNSGNNTPSATPSTATTATTGFASMKGNLPRPVSGQFNIYSHFGTQALPDMPEVKFNNPGIDATVEKGAAARAVYPGTVTGIYVLPGYSTVIIISHGDYYTVYGNIGNPSVSKGDAVKQGQELGKLVSDPDEGGRTSIHFEVWKHREKQNPEAWIR